MSSPLGEYRRCPVCKNWGFEKTHTCAKKWEAICIDRHGEDEAYPVFSNGDEEDAAIAFAEKNFGDWEYPEEMEIWVRKNGNEPWSKFDISVESVPSFTATPKKPEEPCQP